MARFVTKPAKVRKRKSNDPASDSEYQPGDSDFEEDSRKNWKKKKTLAKSFQQGNVLF